MNIQLIDGTTQASITVKEQGRSFAHSGFLIWSHCRCIGNSIHIIDVLIQMYKKAKMCFPYCEEKHKFLLNREVKTTNFASTFI
jgi:chloramphenicol O-acetyltransferase